MYHRSYWRKNWQRSPLVLYTKVFYSDTGSAAVEIALKVAYQYWQGISIPSSIGIKTNSSPLTKHTTAMILSVP